MTKNWKNVELKKLCKYFCFTYPLSSIKNVQVAGEAFSSQKRTPRTSKNEVSWLFLYFCPPWSGSGFRILIGSTDLIESESETLITHTGMDYLLSDQPLCLMVPLAIQWNLASGKWKPATIAEFDLKSRNPIFGMNLTCQDFDIFFYAQFNMRLYINY
jgi:hypothetical protein